MNLLHNLRYPGLIAATACLASFVPQARAQLTLRYEENFGTHVAGEAFSGPFRINLQNFDMGATYPTFPEGTAAGYGANGTGPQSVSGGIGTLDSLGSGTTGSYIQPTTINGVAQPGSLGPDDSWGIARIISITDLDGGVVWSEQGTNQQLTTMFYGAKDFYINQLANGFQEISSVGLHVDLYLQNKTAADYTAYNPLLGSAGRTAVDNYTSVTDGFKILSSVSVGGFINNAGTLGGLSTEFRSTYNNTSGGTGQVYLSVTGGTDAALFNSNYFNSPFISGVTADLFAQFTTVVNTSTADWLVRSNDPVTGNFVPVPEPSTYALGAAAALVGMVAMRRRQQRKAV